MGLTDLLRLNSIFGGGNSSLGQGVRWPMFGGQQPQMQDEEPMDILPSRELPDFNRYPRSKADIAGDILSNPPDPMQNRPSLLRYLGTGALSALNAQQPDKVTLQIDDKGKVRRTIQKGVWSPMGVEDVEPILNAPYRSKVASWKIAADSARQAADMEEKSLNNESLRRQRGITGTVAMNREGRLTEEGRIKLEQAQQRIDQAQQKIYQNQQRIDHVNSRQDITDSEKLALTNKYKQEQMILKGQLDRDIQQLRGSQRMEQIDFQGDINKDLQELRGSQRMEQIGATGAEQRETVAARGEEARKTKSTPSPTAGVTGSIPTQRKVAEQLKANQVIQNHPDWEKWISIDPNTGLVKVAPSGGWRGPDEDTRKAILKELGSGGESTPNTTTTGGKPTATAQPDSSKPQFSGKRVMVVDPRGNRFTIPEEQLNHPRVKELGLKVVKQ